MNTPVRLTSTQLEELNDRKLVAVHSDFIIGMDAFPDRTDFETFISFLCTMQKRHGTKYKVVTADAGSESLDHDL
ncbi:MAG: hypothetical protein RR135_03390 [Oscillospiraceae bacterium]